MTWTKWEEEDDEDDDDADGGKDQVPLPAGSEKYLRDGVEATLSEGFSVSFIAWHAKGDYLATVATGASKKKSVLVHQVTKRTSANPFRKLDSVQSTSFHPTKPYLIVATQTLVRIYDLFKKELVKKLISGAKWISSMVVHPSGDHIVIGTYDKRVIWFDLDLSNKPGRPCGTMTGLFEMSISIQHTPCWQRA